MRPVIVLGALAASLVCCAGMAFAQKSGGILRIYHRDNPPSLSIHEEATHSTVIPITSVMNNLTTISTSRRTAPDDVAPDLAKSWARSADGRDLTSGLEEGVKWHDGKSFATRDVVCTFDMPTCRK